MANEQGNNANDQGPGGSPFTRPAFLVSAVLVALILVLGVIVAIRVAGNNNAAAPSPGPTSVPASSSPPTPTNDPSASVCGLATSAETSPPISAPPATWDYDDTTAYPSSPEFGPGKDADQGYRYCFQNSPTGSVFAAANALAQGSASDVPTVDAWARYFISEGAGRAKLLEELGKPRTETTGVRMAIVGFKVLSHDAGSARVDIAVQTSSNAQTFYASVVYELVWQGGDWKLNSDSTAPFNFSTIPTVDGYVPWKA